MPDETPNTPLREAAISLHEMYTELRRAGFEKSEALTLVAKTLAESFAAGVNEANGDND